MGFSQKEIICQKLNDEAKIKIRRKKAKKLVVIKWACKKASQSPLYDKIVLE